MEQKCKIGGKNLGNRNVVNEDRISELPEVLLLQILSSLATKNVIATSVLSKRWRSLWKMVSKLTFDSDDHQAFSEDVYRSLISHKAPFLDSLRLTISDESDASDIGIWIGYAFARHVRRLVLNIDLEVRFPSLLCSWNDTLEILKLKYCILVDFPTRVCLLSLRKLHLYYVQFRDEASVCNLLCGCPVLEDLFVNRISNFDVETFTIATPSLQMLTIDDDDSVEGEGGYVINAPSLKYLNIDGSGFAGLEFFLIENAPELVEAKIKGISNITNENILESLTSAKRLSLLVSPLEIKHPTGKIFYQLLSLELMSTNENEWWNLLSLMLYTSPKLQVLKLIDSTWYGGKVCLVDKWNQPKRVPECLLYHLETFVWTKYQWQREADKEVATYILKNARRLKKATLSTESIESKEFEKLEKRREMLNELASVVKASKSCHLVLESDTYSYNEDEDEDCFS